MFLLEQGLSFAFLQSSITNSGAHGRFTFGRMPPNYLVQFYNGLQAAEAAAAGSSRKGCFFMLFEPLWAIKDKASRELFMASFTNNPYVFTYSVDMAASSMEIHTLFA